MTSRRKSKKKIPGRSSALEREAKIPRVERSLYGQFVPDVTHTRLKFGLAATNTTSTAFGISALAANDVRDPGIAITATSALGFAGLMANYHQFYVLGSTIRIRCSHGSTSSGVGSTAVNSIVGVFPSVGATSANDRASAEAQAGCKFVSFDIGGMKTLSAYVPCAQLVGVTHAQYIADPTNWGSASASPTDNHLWNLWNLSSCAQTGVDIIMDIEIVYDCVFFRRKSLDLTFERQLLRLVLLAEEREMKRKLESKKLPPALVVSEAGAEDLSWTEVKAVEPPTPSKVGASAAQKPDKIEPAGRFAFDLRTTFPSNGPSAAPPRGR